MLTMALPLFQCPLCRHSLALFFFPNPASVSSFICALYYPPLCVSPSAFICLNASSSLLSCFYILLCFFLAFLKCYWSTHSLTRALYGCKNKAYVIIKLGLGHQTNTSRMCNRLNSLLLEMSLLLFANLNKRYLF